MKERKLRGVCEKSSRLDAESAREGDDIEQSDVSLAAFDISDIVAMKAGYLGKFFLGEIPLKTQFAQLLSKNGSGISRGHAMSLLRMTTMSLHTMSGVYSKERAHPDCPGSCEERQDLLLYIARGFAIVAMVDPG